MARFRSALVSGILDVRVVRWRMKLGYALVAWGLGFALVRGAGARGAPSVVVEVLGTVFDLTFVYYGSRIFRGRNEVLRADRPLWQMTARPTASRRLSTLFFWLVALETVSAVVLIIASTVKPAGVFMRPVPLLQWWSTGTGFVEFLVLAILFRVSARRLTQLASAAHSDGALNRRSVTDGDATIAG